MAAGLSGLRDEVSKQYYCCEADEQYFDFCLHLIGSIHLNNFDHVEQIAVFDLGLNSDQRCYLQTIEKVKVYDVERTHFQLLDHMQTGVAVIQGGFYPLVKRGFNAWKPVIIKQALEMFPYVLYLGVRSLVCKPLNLLFKLLKTQGYFLVEDPPWDVCGTMKHYTIGEQCTQYVQKKLLLDHNDMLWIAKSRNIIPSVIGVHADYYKRFIKPLYELSRDLAMFEDDGTCSGSYGAARCEQTLFSIYARMLQMRDIKAHDEVRLISDDGASHFVCSNSLQKNPHILFDSNGKNNYKESIRFNKPKLDAWSKKMEALHAYQKPIFIIVPSYNNKEWLNSNLGSIVNQNYTNYCVIYIDDASPDGTADLVEQYIKKNQLESHVILIRNLQRKGALENLYNAVQRCPDNAIIGVVDGDDFLASNDVLQTINRAYADENVWLTYGQFVSWPNLEYGFCNYYPAATIYYNMFRQYYYISSHFRTFYAWLFKKIRREDFMIDSQFFSASTDRAIMYPMLEMAGTHTKFIPKILYLYNRKTPLNIDKINPQLQIQVTEYIRSKTPYQPLKEGVSL